MWPKKRDIWVLSDEVYSRLVYGPAPTSIATLPGMMDRTIICDGFSKTFSMTGWRLGYGIMPPALAQRVDLLLNHSIGCTANFTQHAGVEAIRGDQEQVEEVVEVYRQRRDVLIPGLNDIPGVSCRTPQGAFDAFPNVSALAAAPTGWRITCSTRPGWRCSQAPLLVNTARDTCGLASPIH